MRLPSPRAIAVSVFDALSHRWRILVHRRRAAGELEAELRFHLELEAMHAAHADHSIGAARDAARRRLGNTTWITEEVRSMWTGTWIETLIQDARIGVRGLWRNPLFALAAIITLALGIGACTAIFSFADALLLRPFPQLDTSRLLWIVQRSRECPTCDKASAADFVALRERAHTLAGVVAAAQWQATLTRAEETDLLDGYRVSLEIFRMIGAPFARGRGFVNGEDVPGRDHVAVISYDLWTSRFNASPGVIDSTVTINGQPYTVIGVLARGFVFPTRVDVYAPLHIGPAEAADHLSRYLDLFARLAPGRTVDEAHREVLSLSRSIAAEFPATDAGWSLVARPLRSFHTDDTRQLVLIVGVAVLVVLLAACASVANLTLARAMARRREFAVRAALGARRARLARHLFGEALLLALVAGALGAFLARWGVHIIQDTVPASFARYAPGWEFMAVDARALGFTLGAALLTAITFALFPTLRSTRLDLTTVLSEGARGAAGGMHGARLRSTLVVVEVSLALVLLIGASLLVRSVAGMERDNPGVRIDHVLTMNLALPRGQSDSAALHFVTSLDERLGALPGVRAAGLTSTLPLSNNSWGTTFDIPGRPPEPAGRRLSAQDQRVTPDYFRAMGIRLVQGRWLEASDRAGTRHVVLINRYMADRFWPGTSAVGAILLIDSIPWTVAGVVSNVRDGGMDEPQRFEIYRPIVQAMTHSVALAVWTTGDPSRVAPAVRHLVSTIDPRAATAGVLTMEQMAGRHYSPFRLTAGLVGVFAVVALVIAAVGLYGVIAYSVAQRTREIGVRMALGARTRDIVREIGAQALRLTALGLLIGAAGAFGFAQLLTAMLYGVTATDPRTPFAVAAVLFAVAMAAALIPAWRAARLSPTIALREQ